MNHTKETSEEKRERLRQQELKNNPGGALNDGFNRANSGTGDIGWKGTVVLIILLIVGYCMYQFLFK